MTRLFATLLLLAVVYVGSYLMFRLGNVETWQQDGQDYLFFPQDEIGSSLYYLWRPLTYVDGAATGMRFHLGPHQQPAAGATP